MNAELSALRAKPPVFIPGYVLNGYQILNKLTCQIPNIYWYQDGFVTIFLKVLNHLLTDNRGKPAMIDSDATMEVARGVFEELSYFHQLHPEVVRDLDKDAEVEIFIDALVTEISAWAEEEAFPPYGCRVIRIFSDGGSIACDLEAR